MKTLILAATAALLSTTAALAETNDEKIARILKKMEADPSFVAESLKRAGERNADRVSEIEGRTQAGLDLVVDNFTVERTEIGERAEATLKLTNRTGAMATFIFVECAMLDGQGRALDTAPEIISNVPAGGVAYGEAVAWEKTLHGVKSVSCRITRAR